MPRPPASRIKNNGEHRSPSQQSGAETQNRTGDTRIFSPLLYQLSYLGPLQRTHGTRGAPGIVNGREASRRSGGLSSRPRPGDHRSRNQIGPAAAPRLEKRPEDADAGTRQAEGRAEPAQERPAPGRGRRRRRCALRCRPAPCPACVPWTREKRRDRRG